ncbi:outer membrane lipoprotein chaperone LolA [Xylophilus sp.]|uniref:outer membrane lipoprotein chaperone LolA n=1 Tax=Xylophilus sp. TaxID=2653893 RepID=UPI0013B6ECF5|nr:outer membrane lipoprotein chaperone LolA [Xylophilus sp.]KAF1045021.1 MAG: Outer-membrane lipoprotein carrier protein [Xylophilus sp.]
MTLSRIAAALALAGAAFAAQADGLASLDRFLQSTRSGRADFTQTVTSPPRDGQAARTRNSSGTFEFQRPGRFRFVYTRPFAQTIVADGRSLWLYDADLNQVTERPQSQALGATPAALLAATPDLKSLQADFTLEAAPDADGLQWVLATPKARDGQLQSVKVGFRGDTLAALDMRDNFGQRSLIRFENVQANLALPPATFTFKPPAGADVVKQ